MKPQRVQWGEAICLVHALFPELAFQITDPEKMRPDPIAAAFRELGIELQWEELANPVNCDSDIFRQLVRDPASLTGQAMLLGGTRQRVEKTGPVVVSSSELEPFIDGFKESFGEPFFSDDAVILVPENQVLFLVKKGRQLTRYCNS